MNGYQKKTKFLMENTEKKHQKIVGKVNNKEITEEEINLQTQRIAKIQQFSIPDENTEERKKLEQSVLNYIINDHLLLEDAKKQGLWATEQEVNAHFSAAAGQMGGEDKLAQTLQNIGTTKDQLCEDLAKQITIEKYFNSVKEKNNITVSQEEIQDFYQKNVAPQKPGLDIKTVEGQIHKAIEQNKLNRPISEIIQNLRNKADIAIYSH